MKCNLPNQQGEYLIASITKINKILQMILSTNPRTTLFTVMHSDEEEENGDFYRNLSIPNQTLCDYYYWWQFQY